MAATELSCGVHPVKTECCFPNFSSCNCVKPATSKDLNSTRHIRGGRPFSIISFAKYLRNGYPLMFLIVIVVVSCTVTI